jgi:hypothetical protein
MMGREVCAAVVAGSDGRDGVADCMHALPCLVYGQPRTGATQLQPSVTLTLTLTLTLALTLTLNLAPNPTPTPILTLHRCCSTRTKRLSTSQRRA